MCTLGARHARPDSIGMNSPREIRKGTEGYYSSGSVHAPMLSNIWCLDVMQYSLKLPFDTRNTPRTRTCSFNSRSKRSRLRVAYFVGSFCRRQHSLCISKIAESFLVVFFISDYCLMEALSRVVFQNWKFRCHLLVLAAVLSVHTTWILNICWRQKKKDLDLVRCMPPEEKLIHAEP